MKRKRVWITGLLIVVGLLLAAYLGAGYVLYQQLADISDNCQRFTRNSPDYFEPGRWEQYGFDPSRYYMDTYELVHFPSREPGLTIAGWYVPAASVPAASMPAASMPAASMPTTAPTVIIVHGLGACKADPVVLTHAGMLWQHDFNVLLVDVRDSGDSDFEDGLSAIGTEEYLDVLGAWDWLQSEKGVPAAEIGLVGNSLGAATALIAFAEEPQLAALFVDSPIDNLPQIIREELARSNYPQSLYPAGIIMARLVSGDNILAHNPYDGIDKAAGRPIFITHSRADGRVAVVHSEQLVARAEALGANIEFWFVDDAEHVAAPAVYPEAYEAHLVSFFERTLR